MFRNDAQKRDDMYLSRTARKENRYQMTQEDKTAKMKYTATESKLISKRSLGKYIEVHVRADLCAPIQVLSPGREPTTKRELKTLHQITKFLK